MFKTIFFASLNHAHFAIVRNTKYNTVKTLQGQGRTETLSTLLTREIMRQVHINLRITTKAGRVQVNCCEYIKADTQETPLLQPSSELKPNENI